MGLYLSLYMLLWKAVSFPLESQRPTNIKAPLPESQNHRMVEIGGDLWSSSCLIPLLQEGHLQLAAQDYVQGWRLHQFSEQHLPSLHHPQGKKVFPASSHSHGTQGWRSRAAVVEKCWRKGGRAEGCGWRTTGAVWVQRCWQEDPAGTWLPPRPLSMAPRFPGLRERWPRRWAGGLDRSVPVAGRGRWEGWKAFPAMACALGFASRRCGNIP